MRTECSICGRYFAVELSVKDYGFMRIRIGELMDYHWQLHHQGSPKISAILNEEYEGVSNVAAPPSTSTTATPNSTPPTE